MALPVKSAGTWHNTRIAWVKSGGSWVHARRVWARSGGIWYLVLPAPSDVGNLSFTTPGTYGVTVPNGIFALNWQGQAGGGSGGGGEVGNGYFGGGGNGGAGGGYVNVNSVVVTPGQSLIIVVGAGGTSVQNTNVGWQNTSDGINGGDSYISGLGIAHGGSGGPRGRSSYVQGPYGSSIGGTYDLQGQAGGGANGTAGLVATETGLDPGGFDAAMDGRSGAGGSSGTGAGGGANVDNANIMGNNSGANGGNGSLYGGGGGGGAGQFTLGRNEASGTGAGGYINLQWVY